MKMHVCLKKKKLPKKYKKENKVTTQKEDTVSFWLLFVKYVYVPQASGPWRPEGEVRALKCTDRCEPAQASERAASTLNHDSSP